MPHIVVFRLPLLLHLYLKSIHEMYCFDYWVDIFVALLCMCFLPFFSIRGICFIVLSLDCCDIFMWLACDWLILFFCIIFVYYTMMSFPIYLTVITMFVLYFLWCFCQHFVFGVHCNSVSSFVYTFCKVFAILFYVGTILFCVITMYLNIQRLLVIVMYAESWISD